MNPPYDTPPVPEFIDPVFVKTSPKRSFSITENEHFELVLTKTGSINSGTEAVDMNGRIQMQGGKNWILPK
jgi:hypothetical protein